MTPRQQHLVSSLTRVRDLRRALEAELVVKAAALVAWHEERVEDDGPRAHPVERAGDEVRAFLGGLGWPEAEVDLVGVRNPTVRKVLEQARR